MRLPKPAAALLRFALTHGFLKDALIGLVSTALSDYRQLRAKVGLQRYSEDEMIAKLAAAGFSASRAPIARISLCLSSHAVCRLTPSLRASSIELIPFLPGARW